jgi:pimeloyl-ACP methyl ester carboxylesterase
LDKTLKAILDACVESGPEGCSLAEESQSADELEKKVHMLFRSLSENPLIWPAELIDYTMLTSGFYLDGSTLRDMMIPALYAPPAYHFLMTALAGLLKGDIMPALGLRSLGAKSSGATITEALSSIYCSDRRSPRDTSIEAAQAAAIIQREQSSLVGGFLQMLINPIGCANWPFTAKEIYKGDFKLDTQKNPFLVLGNTHDPVTPLSSARNVADELDGSILVEVNGFGVS